MLCSNCNQMFMPTRKDSKYCSDACRQCSYRHRKAVETRYDDIRISYASEVERLKADDPYGKDSTFLLAREYVLDSEHIRRALECCRLANISPDYYINRYLKNDKSIPLNMEVDTIMRDILKDTRR